MEACRNNWRKTSTPLRTSTTLLTPTNTLDLELFCFSPQGVLLVGTDLYTVGGTDGQTYAMDIHKLDLKTREWEEIYISKGNLSDLQPSPRLVGGRVLLSFFVKPRNPLTGPLKLTNELGGVVNSI